MQTTPLPFEVFFFTLSEELRAPARGFFQKKALLTWGLYGEP
jgi:hypothetical protein